MLHDCMQAPKGGSATEYLLLLIAQIRHTLINRLAEVSVCELFMPLHDPFGRFPPGNPNLSLFGFPQSGVRSA